MPDRLPFDALLFDFDGVLASSEEQHCKTFGQCLSAQQGTLTQEEYASRYIHGDDATVFRLLSEHRGYGWSEAQVQELVKKKQALFLASMDSLDLLFPGAAALIELVSKRFPLAVVSMADRDLIDKVLAAGKIQSCFSTIVSVEDVSKPKPDPEPYLLGLERLKKIHRDRPMVPERCLVIEDSCGGVKAGKAAGMKVVALLHSQPKKDLLGAGADVIVEGIPELDRFLLNPVFSK